MSDESKVGSLLDAVLSLDSSGSVSKTSMLDKHTSELAVLVERGVSTSKIVAGLEMVGVRVSPTLLRGYLKDNFPSVYKENYTDKLIGGKASRKPKGRTINKKKDSCQQVISSVDKKVGNTKKTTTQAKSKSKSKDESSSMVQSYLDENQNK